MKGEKKEVRTGWMGTIRKDSEDVGQAAQDRRFEGHLLWLHPLPAQRQVEVADPLQPGQGGSDPI